MNPAYLAGLGGVMDSTGTKPILIAAATPANVAKAQAAMPGVTIPTFFQNAAAANPTSSTVTIAHGLVAFPQYSGVTDTWGSNVGNFSYNSLQITLLQRNLGTSGIKYVDSNAFATPHNVSTVSTQQYLLGNAPRTRAYNLNNPGTQNFDASLRRSFSLPEGMAILFEVDCLNVWNKVTFSAPNAVWGGAAFGTIGGVANTQRDFQLAGHFNF